MTTSGRNNFHLYNQYYVELTTDAPTQSFNLGVAYNDDYATESAYFNYATKYGDLHVIMENSADPTASFSASFNIYGYLDTGDHPTLVTTAVVTGTFGNIDVPINDIVGYRWLYVNQNDGDAVKVRLVHAPKR